MHPIEHIRRFATLSPEVEQRLLAVMKRVQFAKGETLQGHSTLNSNAFYLERGASRLFYTRGGKEHTISFAFDDRFVVVPPSLLERTGDTLALQFLEPSTLIFIPHESVRNQLEAPGVVDSTEGLLFMNAALLHYATYLEDRVDVMQTLSAPERYAWALKRFPRLNECATTTQIASYLGLTKETLYRIKSGKY